MSLDESLFEPKTIKTNLLTSKKKPFNYGLVIGTKPDEHKLALHARLQPKQLSKFAKQTNKQSKKAAWGGLKTSSDNVLTITYEKKCEGLLKAWRQLLKLLQLNSWDLHLVGPDGEVEEVDEGTKDNLVQETIAATGGELSGQTDKLMVSLANAAARIKALPKGALATELWGQAGDIKALVKKGETGSLVEAAKSLARLRDAIAKAEAGKDPSQEPRLLSADSLLPALEKIDFIKDKLIDSDGNDRVLRQGQTAREHITKVLQSYEAHFKDSHTSDTNNAMMLVAALGAIGREIAAELNDFSIQPVLTKKLLQAHQRDIVKVLAAENGNPDKDKIKRSMILLEALVGDNPLGLYMHKEQDKSVGVSRKIRTEDAVERIRGMALKAGVKPTKMLQLLSQLHQIEMGAFDRDEIKQGELNEGKGFETKNLIGEISEEFFTGLLDLDDQGKAQWEKDPEKKAAALAYTKPAQDKLDQLKELLKPWDNEAEEIAKEKADYEARRVLVDKEEGKVKPPAAESGKPKAEDRREEDRGEEADEREDLAEDEGWATEKMLDELRALGDRVGSVLTTSQDRDYVPPVGLEEKNITPAEQDQFRQPLSEKQYALIRQKIRDEFDEKLEENVPQARANVVKCFKIDYGLSEKEAEALVTKCEKWLEQVPMTITFPAEKLFANGAAPVFGTDYLSTQQIDKDVQEASDLVGGDEATGSVRTIKPQDSYAQDRGKEYQRWRKEKDDRETGKSGFMPDESARFGAANINLPKTKGGKGSSYGNEHFVLKDSIRANSTFCFTTKGEERRSMMMVLDDIVRHPKRDNYLPMIINNANGISKTFDMADLDLEFHCYGPIDLTKDVASISIPDDASMIDPKIKKSVERFAKANGIPEPTEWSKLDAEETYDRPAPSAEERAAIIVQVRGIDPKTEPERYAYEVAKQVFLGYRPLYANDDLFENNYKKVKAEMVALARTTLSSPEKKTLKKDKADIETTRKDRLSDAQSKEPEIQNFTLKRNELMNARVGAGLLDVYVKNMLQAYDGIFAAGSNLSDKRQDKLRPAAASLVSTGVKHALSLYEIEGKPAPDFLQPIDRWL